MAFKVIIIDDDPINNMVCITQIKRRSPETEIVDFISPANGLKYITDKYSNGNANQKTTLLLDINMPIMSGWEFLEKFNSLSANIKHNFTIFILSSSFDLSDTSKSETSALIKAFISKPLTPADLEMIFQVI